MSCNMGHWGCSLFMCLTSRSDLDAWLQGHQQPAAGGVPQVVLALRQVAYEKTRPEGIQVMPHLTRIQHQRRQTGAPVCDCLVPGTIASLCSTADSFAVVGKNCLTCGAISRSVGQRSRPLWPYKAQSSVVKCEVTDEHYYHTMFKLNGTSGVTAY